MFLINRKNALPLLLILFTAAAIAVWNYVHELRAKFPDLDFSRAQIGRSSWYSRNDPGINPRTANNEKFDDNAMTCASYDYPFQEELLVINAMNGKWVVCRVNDRGPNKRLNRKIDLTKAAFRKIARTRKGLINVTIIPTRKLAAKKAEAAAKAA
ncbi:MAG TPA: septal ring lytic transglycosylase RlpA family protein [Verrucomicrobiae bacterium]|jgi:rare lipoprotein A|nr:septal ring lytic transglycosylase RlpA family protein [Verrucomicrobiae bacterium]